MPRWGKKGVMTHTAALMTVFWHRSNWAAAYRHPPWLDGGMRLDALLTTLASHPVQPARVAADAVGRHEVTGGSHRLMHGQSGHRSTA